MRPESEACYTLDEARGMSNDGDINIAERKTAYLTFKGYDTRLTDDDILNIERFLDDDVEPDEFVTLMVQAEQDKLTATTDTSAAPEATPQEAPASTAA